MYVSENGPILGYTGASNIEDIIPNGVVVFGTEGMDACVLGFDLLNPGALNARRKSNGMNISISVVRQDRVAIKRRFHISKEI
tara:strand:+ start:1800 stop:2048 length:249 start_codon:yes stop_codon:yes gene_type:complete